MTRAKPRSAQKTRLLMFRATEDIAAELYAAAKRANMDFSEWARMHLLWVARTSAPAPRKRP